MSNYSFKTTGLPDPVNGVVEGHNFTQGSPHTEIYAGQMGLTFRNCNLTNCDVPVDAVVIGCNCGHASFCSHLHPDWLEKNYISACPESCSHQKVVDTVIIDGNSIETYIYED